MLKGLSGLWFCALLSLAPAAVAEVKPASIFSDHAVLQAGMAVPVWGTAAAGEKVTVSINGSSASAIAGADGRWIVRLKKLKAGGPFEMKIGGTNTVTVHDVLVGEVWLGSGQSNMVFTLSKKNNPWAGVDDEQKVIAGANNPMVRLFTGKATKTYEPQKDIEGEWKLCTPENAGDFSAVAYYFATDLQRELKLPVGMVVEAYGASTAESWLPRDVVAADPQLKPRLEAFDSRVAYFREHPGATNAGAPAAPMTINGRAQAADAKLRDPVQDQHEPTVLYNGMIAPVLPYAIRGILWYQGESIVGGRHGVEVYPHTMETLVKTWRARWGEGELPFYFVQLAALDNVSNNPAVREAQAQLLKLPHTAMAVTIDIGDETNVHPKRKAALGERLTAIALAKSYGRKVESSGPVYRLLKIEGSKAIVSFDHAVGLASKNGAPAEFEIAGTDERFVPAQAIVQGDAVVISSSEVAAPVAVRYAWKNYPKDANLYNGAGLPAAPFRTDSWDALTPVTARLTGK